MKGNMPWHSMMRSAAARSRRQPRAAAPGTNSLHVQFGTKLAVLPNSSLLHDSQRHIPKYQSLLLPLLIVLCSIAC